ncbi:MAG: LptF/LptG family permease [Bacteroidales bacterium]|nr:LptF/LptG family permease [Bacteroidales bacterium]
MNSDKKILNIIDFYIIRKILTTFFIAIMLISFIIIIIDLSFKLDDYIDHHAPVKAIVFNYYLNTIPHYFDLYGYLFFFISVVFVTSNLTSKSETVAILCGGISFGRFLRPFIISSVFIGLLSLIISNFLIPHVNISLYEFDQKYYRNKYVNSFVDIHIQSTDSTQVYVHHFDNKTNTGFLFTKETFANNRIKEKVYADIINYDTAKREWVMTNYSVRHINGKNENLTFGISSKIDINGLEPNDFNKILKADQLNFNQLNRAIDRERMKGSSAVRDLLIIKYQRLLTPIAYIILTLIGVSLSCKKTRGGTGLYIAAGIALAFSLILLMKIFNVFATNGSLPPFLAPLIPLLIFTFTAIYLTKIAPK